MDKEKSIYKKSKVILIAGSTSFKDDIMFHAEELTLRGNVVLTPTIFSHSNGRELDDDQISLLRDNFYQKIDMCDIMMVVNRNGYIGKDTLLDIAYATAAGKEIVYVEPLNVDKVFTVITIPYPFDGDMDKCNVISSARDIFSVEESYRLYEASIEDPRRIGRTMHKGLDYCVLVICNLKKYDK